MLNGLSINHYLLCLLMSLGIHSSHAAGGIENRLTTKIHPVFTLTAGASISPLGQSQTFAPLDLCSYQYQSQGTRTNMLRGGFLGTEVKRYSSWGLMAGVGYYQPTILSTAGTLIQGADPESDNAYSYRYQTRSQQILAEGKLYWITRERIHPFVMMGIGAAINTTDRYQTNVPPFLELTPVFPNHRQINVTYAIGPGIEFAVTKAFRLGIGYRFTHLGSANTGSAQIDGIPISSTLKQSPLYANQILAQFTFTPWTRD